jgi:hypothetical protein
MRSGVAASFSRPLALTVDTARISESAEIHI